MAEAAIGRLTSVFLDRDGVINEKAPEGDYVKSWSEFVFLPTALAGLRMLAEHRLKIVVVTNQRGIARGVMSERDLADIHARMGEEVARAGGRIHAIYHCPHAGGCDCRKPAPGMLLAAAREHPDIELKRSALVGDRVHDMQAASAVGAQRVYLRGFPEPLPDVDHIADDLLEAAAWVVGRAEPGRAAA